MKKLILLALILAASVAAVPKQQFVLPFAPDCVFDSDTFHVTTSEKGWALDPTAYKLTIINPNNYFLLVRFSNVAGVLQTFIGPYGTAVYEAPSVWGTAIDSVFIDGEGACTVYAEWWGVE
jgi:hypothetical protein